MLVLRVGQNSFSRDGNDITVLKSRGLNAEFAASGRDGLDVLRADDYDLVLVDMNNTTKVTKENL